MVQVLPYVQTPLEQLTPYVNQAAGAVGAGLGQRSALKSLEEYYNKPSDSKPNSDEIDPQELQHIYSLHEKARPGTGQIAVKAKIENQKIQARKNIQERKFEEQREARAEPDLLERETKLNHFEQEDARFERLQNLFVPELEDKFPSSLTVGLFTKDGELRPSVASQLSPEAQEAVKLIADNLTGAKDTFGARVTNFDLQSYMKRLPTLLNTAEGRRRVLRDLRLMNKLNRNHEKGVLDIVDREGGPQKISISKAERLYRKEHAKEIEDIKKEFVNPERKNFSSLESIDPKVYQGRVVVDEETGQKFRSNGKDWVPEE